MSLHRASYSAYLHLTPWAASAGIRNVVGMQFHPVLQTLYFSNNGRDNVGGDVPDDYIAYAPVAGLNFGYPYCHRQVAVRFAWSIPGVGVIMPHFNQSISVNSLALGVIRACMS